MTQTADPMFRCDICGRRHPWSPERAGQTFTCQCTEPITVPPEPESDLYDLAPAPLAAPIPAILSQDPAYPVLSYRQPTTSSSLENSYSTSNPMIVSTWRDLAFPIALIALGAIAQFLFQLHLTGSAPSAFRSVGNSFIANTLIMLIGVIAAARILGVSFGSVPTAILKLGAIAIGPGALAVIVSTAIGAGIAGLLIGIALSLTLYFWLFWYLFELDTEDVWMTVLIIYGIRFLAGLLLMIL